MYVLRTFILAVKFIEPFFGDLLDCLSYNLKALLVYYIVPLVSNNGSGEYIKYNIYA